MYFCTFKGKTVSIKTDKGVTHRTLCIPYEVTGAQVNGESVVVQTAKVTYLYALDGRMMRQVVN